MTSNTSGMQKKHKLHLSQGMFQRLTQHLCDAKQLHTQIKKDKKDFMNHPIRYLRIFLHMPSFAL